MKDGKKEEIWEKGGNRHFMSGPNNNRDFRQYFRKCESIKIRVDEHNLDKLWKEQSGLRKSYGKAPQCRVPLLEIPVRFME